MHSHHSHADEGRAPRVLPVPASHTGSWQALGSSWSRGGGRQSEWSPPYGQPWSLYLPGRGPQADVSLIARQSPEFPGRPAKHLCLQVGIPGQTLDEGASGSGTVLVTQLPGRMTRVL